MNITRTQRIYAIDWTAAAALRRQMIQELQTDGYRVTEWSEGTRYEIRGSEFTGMEVTVSARKPDAPLTQYERMMIRECSGHD